MDDDDLAAWDQMEQELHQLMEDSQWLFAF